MKAKRPTLFHSSDMANDSIAWMNPERAAFIALPEALQAELTRLTAIEKPDSVVEARGWVFFSGGPMIEVKVSAQFEILGPGSDKIIEGCAS